MNLKMVRLLWLDSCVHNERWAEPQAIDPSLGGKALRHVTTGFLYKETDISYAIVQSMTTGRDDDHRVDGVMEIPKVAVLEFRELIPVPHDAAPPDEMVAAAQKQDTSDWRNPSWGRRTPGRRLSDYRV